MGSNPTSVTFFTRETNTLFFANWDKIIKYLRSNHRWYDFYFVWKCILLVSGLLLELIGMERFSNNQRVILFSVLIGLFCSRNEAYKQDTVAEWLRRIISSLRLNEIPNFRSVGSNPTSVTFLIFWRGCIDEEYRHIGKDSIIYQDDLMIIGY